jgi:hypothetical protein
MHNPLSLAPEKHNEKDQTNLLRDFVIELTNNRLIGKLGTCKTSDKDKVLVHLTHPYPVVGTMEPSATCTLSLLRCTCHVVSGS